MANRVKKRMDSWLEKKSKTLSRKGLYEFLAKEFTKIPRGANVLTIGSGGEVNKLLDRFVREQGFNVLSFDIDRKRDPAVVGDICDFDFGDQQFDAVIISEVLEHIHSPHLAINNIYSILKPSGTLILTTPFLLPLHDRPYDYYRYTRYGLEFLLRDFRDIQISERNSYFEAIDTLWVRLWQTNLHSARLASYLIIPFIFYLKRPFTSLLGKLVDTDAMTTGYTVTAVK